MLKNKKIIYFIILMFAVLGAGRFFVSDSEASAAVYYVCNSATTCNAGAGDGWSTGSDSNNGTAKATPYLTIQKCEDTMSPGSTCIVGDGTYSVATDYVVRI